MVKEIQLFSLHCDINTPRWITKTNLIIRETVFNRECQSATCDAATAINLLGNDVTLIESEFVARTHGHIRLGLFH